MYNHILNILACFIFSSPVLAQDRAVILDAQSMGQGFSSEMALTLSNSDFQVISSAGLQAQDLYHFVNLLNKDQANGRRVVILSGTFVHDSAETWLVAANIWPKDRTEAGNNGLPLSYILHYLSNAPGGALLVVNETGTMPQTAELLPGIGALNLPQGVASVTGPPHAIQNFTAQMLPRRGMSLADMAGRVPNITLTGFSAPMVPFRPVDEQTQTSPAFIPPYAAMPAQPPADPDDTAWIGARDIGTLHSFETYLANFPMGKHADMAKMALKTLQEQNLLNAAQIERQIYLTQDQRRDVQKALVAIGYDPDGIDGIFGPKTRTAISNWQKNQGLAISGFLDQKQIFMLLEAAFYKNSAPPVPANIPRPEAVNLPPAAAQAQTEQAIPPQPATAPLELAYLRRYNDGLFAESALALDEPRKRAINGRLIDLKLLEGPSSPDFTADFTDASRAALTVFQQKNGLAATGFVNRETYFALLADKIPLPGVQATPPVTPAP